MHEDNELQNHREADGGSGGEAIEHPAEARDADYDERHLDEERDEGAGEVGIPSSSDGPLHLVAVDWVELEGALENNSPELHSFLNRITGDVIRVFRGSDDADSRLREVEADPEFVYIEPISSREQYRWMEEFIEEVEDPVLKDKLNIAIDGKGAFRRFKDVLVGYPTDREAWFAKRGVKLRAHMNEWLTVKRIEPTNPPPWEIDGDEQGGETRQDGELRYRREGNVDLRQIAHELVDMISSRELPSAVAFLEFLRSRRGSRRPRSA